MKLSMEAPEWNLNDLFPSPENSLITTYLDEISKDVENFIETYQDKLMLLTGSEIYESILKYEELYDKIGKIQAYAYLIYAQDRSNTAVGSFYQTIHELTNQYVSKLLFFTLGLNDFSQDQFLNFYKQHPLLIRYRPWIDNLRLLKDHQLSQDIEQLMQEKSIPAETSWIRLYDEILADQRFEIDGSFYPISEILNRLSHPEEQQRKAAALSLSKGLKDKERIFCMIINTLSQNLSLDNTWRKFPNIDSFRHLQNQIDTDVVDTLTHSVKNAYGRLSHDYYAIKAKKFGKHKLNYWDRNAPYPDATDLTIPWQQAKTIVLNAYHNFSKEMGDIAEQFFDHHWIDAVLRPGKDSGAFSHPVVPSVHPYILMNYHGKQRCVMTLAHELGHGIHQMLARQQGALMADTPLTLAETASVFGEMLTFKSLMQLASPEQRTYLLAGKIEDMLNTVVRQIAFYEFEKRLHKARLKGELSLSQISDIWMDVQSESLGECVELDESYTIYWAYISHFFHAPFYVYAYAFGDCLVNSLYGYYEENPKEFQAKYLDVLKAGGTKRYDEVLKPFGFNLKDPAFWNKGLDVIEKFIHEFKESV